MFKNEDAYSSLEMLKDRLEARDADGVAELLHPDFEGDDAFKGELSRSIKTLPSGKLDFELFYAENRVGTGEHSSTPVYFALYESASEAGYVQLALAVVPLDGACCVGTYLWITPSSVRPSNFNDLTLAGKGWLHYFVFALAVSTFLLTVSTAVKCALDSQTARKWLWVPFVLLGLWGVNFNWTTGALSPSFITISGTYFQFSIIQFKLFGVGVTTPGPFQPWTVGIGTPVGALLYWFLPSIRRKRNSTTDVEGLG